MKSTDQSRSDADRIAELAAAWVLRLDRGLTAEEQDDYSQWLAADPRHREAMALHRWGWDEFDRLAGIQDTVHALPDPDLLRPVRRYRSLAKFWPHAVGLAALVAMIAAVWWPRMPPADEISTRVEPSYALAAPIQERTLEDGSTVALNRGALIETEFSAQARVVKLLRGEANFVVAKDAQRPFVVCAGRVEVRAIGTVFNVRLGNSDVEVVVSHGQVGVSHRSPVEPNQTDDAAELPRPSMEPSRAAARADEVMLTANQKVVLPLTAPPTAPAAAVATLDEGELERRLAWQPRLLDFTDASMSAIVAEFNRRNPVRLVLADPRVEALRLSATIRSDNVEGFVRLLESDFEVKAEWRSETEIALRRK